MIGGFKKAEYISHPDEDQDLFNILCNTQHLLFQTRKKDLFRYGLTPQRAEILSIVQLLDQKATPSRIARLIFLEMRTVCDIIDRMIKSGLLNKTYDLERKNMCRISFTERGKTAYKYCNSYVRINRIIRSLDYEERTRFKIYLEKLILKARSELGMKTNNQILLYTRDATNIFNKDIQ